MIKKRLLSIIIIHNHLLFTVPRVLLFAATAAGVYYYFNLDYYTKNQAKKNRSDEKEALDTEHKKIINTVEQNKEKTINLMAEKAHDLNAIHKKKLQKINEVIEITESSLNDVSHTISNNNKSLENCTQEFELLTTNLNLYLPNEEGLRILTINSPLYKNNFEKNLNDKKLKIDKLNNKISLKKEALEKEYKDFQKKSDKEKNDFEHLINGPNISLIPNYSSSSQLQPRIPITFDKK